MPMTLSSHLTLNPLEGAPSGAGPAKARFAARGRRSGGPVRYHDASTRQVQAPEPGVSQGNIIGDRRPAGQPWLDVIKDLPRQGQNRPAGAAPSTRHRQQRKQRMFCARPAVYPPHLLGDPASLLDRGLLSPGSELRPGHGSMRRPAAGPQARGRCPGSCGDRAPRPALCSTAITVRQLPRWLPDYEAGNPVARDRSIGQPPTAGHPSEPGISLPPGAP